MLVNVLARVFVEGHAHHVEHIGTFVRSMRARVRVRVRCHQLGIQGRVVTIPSFAGLAATDVPWVILLILALLTMFIGMRVLIVAAVLYVIQARQQATQQR